MVELGGDLPAWVRLGPIFLAVGLPFLGAALLVGVAGLAARGAPVPPDAPWYDRARYVWPLRRTVRLATWVAMLLAGFGFGTAGDLLPVPRGVLAAIAVVSAGAGAVAAATPMVRWVWGHPRSARERWGEPLVVLACFYPHLLVVLGALLGTHLRFDRWTIVMIGVGLAGLFLALRGDHLDLLRLVGVVRAPSPRLVAANGRAAAAAGVPAAPVDEVRVGVGSAGAFPLGGRVIATRALVETLDDAQLEAVLAHEYAHLSEPSPVIAARVIGATGFVLPLLLVRPLGGTAGPVAAILALLVGLLTAVAAGRVARRMEERADLAAVGRPGDAGAYAGALEAIYRINLVPAVMDRRRVHPHLYDRLTAAGVAPAFPRPPPPSRVRGWAGAVALVATASGLGLLLTGAAVGTGRGEGDAQLRLALGRGRPSDVADVATARHAAGDAPAAARLYATAAELSPTSAWEPANLSLVLAEMGRCEDAARAAREARGRDAAADDAEEGGADDGEGPLQALFGTVDLGVATCLASRPWGATPPDAAPGP